MWDVAFHGFDDFTAVSGCRSCSRVVAQGSQSYFSGYGQGSGSLVRLDEYPFIPLHWGGYVGKGSVAVGDRIVLFGQNA